LSKDKFGSSVDFLFKPIDFLLSAFIGIGAFGMTLWETSDGDTKVPRVVGVNVFD